MPSSKIADAFILAGRTHESSLATNVTAQNRLRVLWDSSTRIATLELNDPLRSNTMTTGHDMHKAVLSLKLLDPQVVLIQARGDNFCAGSG